ncbi:MFS transporter [Microvirga massiliensis]|uniref:MFS transporter n=1 Tax=Microvirga massiliensis TaxID=1033741 RepID=UPI00062BD729|nr:MFS transporter [Microvirga massiliensis]
MSEPAQPLRALEHAASLESQTFEPPNPSVVSPERTRAAVAERGHSATGTLVWGLSIAQLVGFGTLYFAFALFVTPMGAELGWSRADLNGALTIGLLTTGLASIPCGYLVDRYGGHVLMTLGSVAGAIFLALWSAVDSIAAFYVIWIGIGLATAASVQDLPFAVAIANVRNFRQAIIYITLIAGLSATVFIPVINWLIDAFGWRHALLTLAAIQLVLPSTLHGVFLRGTRGTRSGERVRRGDGREPSALLSALRRPAFWGLAVCFSAQSFAFTTLTFHIIPLLQERGLPLETGIVALALLGPAQVVGRVILIVFGSRTSARIIGRIVTPLLPIAMLLLLTISPNGLAGLALFVLVFGTGNGVLSIVRATGIAEILGTHGYATIVGALNLILMVPRAAAPLTVAALWESQGDYTGVIWMLASMTAAGATAFWLASRESSHGSPRSERCPS